VKKTIFPFYTISFFQRIIPKKTLMERPVAGIFHSNERRRLEVETFRIRGSDETLISPRFSFKKIFSTAFDCPQRGVLAAASITGRLESAGYFIQKDR